MSLGELGRLTDRLVAVARAAGAAILPHYWPGVARAAKTDGSPVTAADHASEAVILPAIAELAPGIPAVAEEAYAAGRVPEIGIGPYFLVDPLDGTREFLRANGEFTVNIALVEGGVPLLGVIHAPITGETFWSSGMGKAFAQRAQAPQHPIRCRPAPPEGQVVLASRSHQDRETLEAYLVGTRVAEIRISGSAMKFCRLAEGAADLYPRLGPTMEWDTAAGQAILTAAGGSVATLDGNPLHYGKPQFLNPPFVARGR